MRNWQPDEAATPSHDAGRADHSGGCAQVAVKSRREPPRPGSLRLSITEATKIARRAFTRVSVREHNELVRVVATRIEWDGTMQRRMVDTAHRRDGPQWEDLAGRALAVPPPYRPVPGTSVYHISLDDGTVVLVAEHDLCGPLLDLVTAVLAMGETVLNAGQLSGPHDADRQVTRPRSLPGPPHRHPDKEEVTGLARALYVQHRGASQSSLRLAS